jgi:hypothetical protein
VAIRQEDWRRRGACDTCHKLHRTAQGGCDTTQALPADEIYRAAIAAVGNLDKMTVLDGADAMRALVPALEQRRLTVQSMETADDEDSKRLLSVDGTEGVVIVAEGEELRLDAGALLRRHHWRRLHLLTFARHALTIRTVAA